MPANEPSPFGVTRPGSAGPLAAVVAAECPSCGAPLDLNDVVRAVRCDHCRSPLLVTGRRETLSYSIAPSLRESEARALLQFSLPPESGAHVKAGTQVLVPYVRHTAETIELETAHPEEQRRRNVRDVAAWLGVSPPASSDEARPAWESAPVEPLGGFLDRNARACTVDLFPPSLGVRPSALSFDLFDPRAWPDETIIVAADAGLEVGALRVDSGCALVGVTRQVLYFPFWVFPVGDSSVVVDAVGGERVRDPQPISKLDELRLRRTSTRIPPRVLGFRPLVCPNCGWDLPLRARDVVFHCRSCDSAWLSLRGRLARTRFEIVEGDRDTACHLPVWRVAWGHEDPIYVPGFRCRRRRALVDLARRLTLRGVGESREEGRVSRLVGCGFDGDDAMALARLFGGPRDATDASARPTVSLFWLPFESDGYALREATTGTPLPLRLLDLEVEGGRGSLFGVTS